jgi:Ca2+-binding EF-hand superfamily protein
MQFAHFFGDRAEKSRTKQREEKTGSSEGSEDELIDIEEFRRLMEDTFKPLNITITEEMVRWNFDKIDTDHSGRISFKEYMTFVKKYNS